jgi:hypothetical protein
MNNKTGALVLALGLLQMSGSAMAAPQGWTTPLNKVCFINSGSIYGGTAPAGLVTVVYGPTQRSVRLLITSFGWG